MDDQSANHDPLREPAAARPRRGPHERPLRRRHLRRVGRSHAAQAHAGALQPGREPLALRGVRGRRRRAPREVERRLPRRDEEGDREVLAPQADRRGGLGRLRARDELRRGDVRGPEDVRAARQAPRRARPRAGHGGQPPLLPRRGPPRSSGRSPRACARRSSCDPPVARRGAARGRAWSSRSRSGTTWRAPAS